MTNNIQVITRTVHAESASAAVKLIRDVPGTVCVRSAKPIGSDRYDVTFDFVGIGS